MPNFSSPSSSPPISSPSHIDNDERDAGFSLDLVLPAYRPLFQKILDALLAEGILGSERPEVTRQVFSLLKRADRGSFDHVLREFLAALNPQTRWLLDLPSIFQEIVELGGAIGSERLPDGIAFFRILGEGGFGSTPTEVSHALRLFRHFLPLDRPFAFAVLRNYRRLLTRLTLEEVDRYVEEGYRLYTAHPLQGLNFLEGERIASETTIVAITQECRLNDVTIELALLLRALVGREIAVMDLDPQLPNGRAISLGRWLCLPHAVYFPPRIRLFPDREKNREVYRLLATIAAGMLLAKTFSYLHGEKGYRTLWDLVEEKEKNLLCILEYVRGIRWVSRTWPGIVRSLHEVLNHECERHPPTTPADQLLHDSLRGSPCSPLFLAFVDLVDHLPDVFAARDALSNEVIHRVAHAYPGIESSPFHPLSLLPDWLSPVELSSPSSSWILSPQQRRRKPEKKQNSQEELRSDAEARGRMGKEEGSLEGRFFYDEWDVFEKAYRRDYCCVWEIRGQISHENSASLQLGEEVRKIRGVFERWKPDRPSRLRYRAEGEEISYDRLVRYLVHRRCEPLPKIDFYDSTRIRERDLATLILMDMSGSTAEKRGDTSILEMEKRAVLLLGEGLEAIGDEFSIVGFSTDGPSRCYYRVFKSFPDAWGEEVKRAIASAQPQHATRIGAILRHAGYRLAERERRRKLLFVITDGRPIDTGYDSANRYAHADVRQACVENARLGIVTIGISFEEKSLARMERMFPHHRFVCLAKVEDLAILLPRLYLRITG